MTPTSYSVECWEGGEQVNVHSGIITEQEAFRRAEWWEAGETEGGADRDAVVYAYYAPRYERISWGEGDAGRYVCEGHTPDAWCPDDKEHRDGLD